jgi:hypothetical protein
MKNKIGILILCLFCQFSFGQIESRKIFKGQERFGTGRKRNCF